MGRKYSQTEIDASIARILHDGMPVSAISAERNIPQSTIYRWIKAYQDEQGITKRPESQNINALIQKVQRLEGIIEILQSANCTANAPLQDRLAELERLYGTYNVHMLCEP